MKPPIYTISSEMITLSIYFIFYILFLQELSITLIGTYWGIAEGDGGLSQILWSSRKASQGPRNEVASKATQVAFRFLFSEREDWNLWSTEGEFQKEECYERDLKREKGVSALVQGKGSPGVGCPLNSMPWLIKLCWTEARTGDELESPVPIPGAQALAVSVTPSVWLPGKEDYLQEKTTELPSGISGLWQGWSCQKVQRHSSFQPGKKWVTLLWSVFGFGF